MPRTVLSVLVFGWLATSLVLGVETSNFHDFAHIGDGSGIRTVFLISNPGGEAATVTLRLLKDDGSPLTLLINGASQSQVEIVIPAGGSLRLETGGTSDPVATGWARLVSTQAVGAQVLFEILVDGELVTQAAVAPLGSILRGTLFVNEDGGSRTPELHWPTPPDPPL